MIEVGTMLRRRISVVQTEQRVPSLTAGIGHQGQSLAVECVGAASVLEETPAQSTTQYRIGSVSKTFTAAMVLLLVERGLLDLDERVGTYLLETSIGRPSLRQLLAHHGGVQREAPLPMWSTMQGPDQDELRQALNRAEMIDRPGACWHYSNLGYAVLGQIAEQVTGVTCEDLIDRELIKPLGLNATTWQPTDAAATGYRLDPYQDVVHPEPRMQQGTIGVGGQLWSTIGDLLTWGHALTGGAPDVLPASVVADMHTAQVMVDREAWTQGWGMGLILDRRPTRIVSGHTGAMPGFVAALSLDRSSQTVVAALSNVTRGVRLGALATGVLEEVVDSLEPSAPTWVMDCTPCPPDLLGVLGRWWCEAEETVFTWQDGDLQAHLGDSPATTRTVFSRHGDDSFRAASGRQQGERLYVIRDEQGQVSQLEWATYPYTRTPR
jgi:CubicO group peptidase (beta-lactamase class C family)